MPDPIAIGRIGLVTGVGFDAGSSCAAIRSAIDNFRETRFQDQYGEWLMGCEVPFAESWRGERRLVEMAAMAIAECLGGATRQSCQHIPLLLCLAETDRPGRIVRDDATFLLALESALNLKFHPMSRVFPDGHVALASALDCARTLVKSDGIRRVLVAASDSLLVGKTLSHLEEHERLLTSAHSDGFIPGEGAGALLIEAPGQSAGPQLLCRGIGFAVEPAHIHSDLPLRANGLTAAIQQSLADAGCGESVLGFKIIDASGGQYAFKEATLAFGRIDRTKRTEFDVWHPADCIGEIGAPIGLVMIAVLKSAFEKAYAKGSNVLLHLGNDDGKRASMIFSWDSGAG